MDQGYAFSNDSEHAELHLGAITALLDPFTQRQISDKVGDLKGKRCLEVGSGNGSIAVWLADQVGPEGFVLATDMTPRAIAPRDNLSVLRHDITTSAPLGGAWDLVHVRLLLNHLPQRRNILHRLANELRPGGVLLSEDYSPTRAIDLVIYARTPQDAALLGQYQAAHYRALAAHGNDRAWSRRAIIAMMEEGLLGTQVVIHGETWRGGGAGCQFMAAGLAQLHDELLEFGMTEGQLDRVCELFNDPAVLLHGHLMYSTSGRKP
jgi:2-polyprenyl-3-methyl-5-hydroxy-6-metoxy-1,4-benzoquinol methylase